MKFQLAEENELDKLANSAKKKNKKEHQQGWFVTLGGNPEKNAEMFNTSMNTGDAPTSGCSEELNEQLKNEYEICYLDYRDHKYIIYIDAYSEKQAALILRKTNKHVKRIVYIDCIKDHSQDDGEQVSLFESTLRDINNRITTALPTCSIRRSEHSDGVIVTTPLGREYSIPIEVTNTYNTSDYTPHRFTGNGTVINGTLTDNSSGATYRCYVGTPRNHEHADYNDTLLVYQLVQNTITGNPIPFTQFSELVKSGKC